MSGAELPTVTSEEGVDSPHAGVSSHVRLSSQSYRDAVGGIPLVEKYR